MELQRIIEEIVMGVLDRQKAQKNQRINNANKLNKEVNSQNNNPQNNNPQNNNPQNNNPQNNNPKNAKQFSQLSDIELKYLITLIGKSDFRGSDLQLIYSITTKLQNQLTNKK